MPSPQSAFRAFEEAAAYDVGSWPWTGEADAGRWEQDEDTAALALPVTPYARSLACDEGLRPLQIEGPACDPVAVFAKARCRKLAAGEGKAAELHSA